MRKWHPCDVGTGQTWLWADPLLMAKRSTKCTRAAAGKIQGKIDFLYFFFLENIVVFPSSPPSREGKSFTGQVN